LNLEIYLNVILKKYDGLIFQLTIFAKTFEEAQSQHKITANKFPICGDNLLFLSSKQEMKE